MRIFALLVALPLCACHAQLNSPAAWNPNPSKSAPCGGGAATVPTARISGQNWKFDWEVVAGDGNGAVEVKVATTGTNFGNVIHTSQVFPNVGKGSFTIPGAITSSITGDVTLQLRSTTNWYACASISAAADPTPPPTEPPRCQVATGLSMCSQLNGKEIQIVPSRDIVAMEAGLLTDRNFNLGNENVFENSVAPGCVDALTRMLCAMTFPLCDAAEDGTNHVCQNTCQNVNTMCSTNPLHQGLYNCRDEAGQPRPKYAATAQDSAGTCPDLGVVGTLFNHQPPAVLTAFPTTTTEPPIADGQPGGTATTAANPEGQACNEGETRRLNCNSCVCSSDRTFVCTQKACALEDVSVAPVAASLSSVALVTLAAAAANQLL